jgi:glycosyltransferase involved in cell wall biosynthesis
MMTDAVGGVWSYSLELARGLGPHGFEVVLAVLGPAPTAEQRREAEAAGIALAHAPYRLEWMSDPWADVDASAAWLGTLERELGCDLCHLNGYSYAAFPFRSPTLVVGHSCVFSWWEAVHGAPPPAPDWQTYHRAVRAGLRAATHVVTPTQWMARELGRLYGGGSTMSAVSVIPNGRAGEAFSAGPKRPFVLAAGRIWDEAKNLRALARVSHDVPWPIEVAGPLSLTSPYDDVSARELAGLVLRGPLGAGDMARAYGEASIYALPACYEPLGLSVLEAALAGCALVVGDIPSLRELWDDAALFVEPRDNDALRRALVHLIEQPAEREDLARRARRRAQRYARERMIAAYAALYQRLLAGPSTEPVEPTDPVPHVPEKKELACAS